MTSYYSPDSPEAFLSNNEVFPEDNKQFLVKLNTVYTDIAKNVNSKDIARYELTEMANGQQFFDASNAQNRKFGFRKCFNFGKIVSGATLTIAHGISSPTSFTRIYGVAIDSAGVYKPLPFSAYSAATADTQIQLTVDTTNIYIVNGVAATALDISSGIVVLEYLKN